MHAAGLSEDGQTFDVQEGSGLVELKDSKKSEEVKR